LCDYYYFFKLFLLKRQDAIQQLDNTTEWDICIIGGGATGLGIAVDAASRGYKTLLIEKYDFAKGTSSRSTKLVHGGVRYLQQGNIKLVMDALKERGLLRKNAPHLVKNQSFVIPNYKWWENPFYGIGLKVYDWMAGSLGLGPSEFLSKEETLAYTPTLDPEGLRGGVLYHDGQFDDARLAVHLAMTAADCGGCVINYCSADGLLKVNGKVSGVKITDTINNNTYEVKAKAVINATGVFTDAILKMDNADSETLVTPSQGIHLVVDKTFLPSQTAIMIPKTDDGRVLFAVPWHNKIIVGTTDTPIQQITTEPKALDQEVEFVMQHMTKYLTKQPAYSDIKSIFAGLRPLVKGNSKSTASLSRDHHISISDSELITITGGKWTTYRKMAEDILEIVIHKTGLPERECKTKSLPIHGYQVTEDFSSPQYYYGSDQTHIHAIVKADTTMGELIHSDLPFIKAEIIWSARNEMSMTVEDALSRRTRALLLDAKAAIASAPLVAALMAKELNRDDNWIQQQINSFTQLATGYLPAKN
jgi:glycerol-3-phosphate dehydrogenase